MKIILLSGGSGKRLWPLSNQIKSKQFLKLFTSTKGQPESMIQRLNNEIHTRFNDSDVFVAAPASQYDIIRSQLGSNIEIICEPQRRDTFPAISLAISFLKFEKKANLDEIVVVMPCDFYSDPNFFSAVQEMAYIASTSVSEVVLMGIRPTEINQKYGYIIPDKKRRNKVNYFIEKPDYNKAERLILNGAYWNGGIFAFRIGFLLNILSKYVEPKSYDHILNNYELLPKISFDYEVLEKCKSISFVRFDGIWRDLGTWTSLCETFTFKTAKNTVINNSHRTIVINDQEIPIICNGIDDAIIVATKEGILITDKKNADDIKPLVEKIE